jgi:Glycosyl hydrolase family 26
MAVFAVVVLASRDALTAEAQLTRTRLATRGQAPVLFGVATPAGPSLADLDAFEARAGKRVGLYLYYESFAHSRFEPAQADAIRARGALPAITWEPWDPAGTADQPDYALQRIISGTYDDYIGEWATEIGAWGHPLLLRFAHEMNGDWYPWCETVNGNRPGDYAAAWRHVHRIFRAAGATNAKWAWTPYVRLPGSLPLAALYPGDEYVDWVGLDGYNWGSTRTWSSWQRFAEIFEPSLAELKAITDKPVMIGEVASTEVGGDKAAWIDDFFDGLKRHHAIRAFAWFNFNKESDWRIESSPAATEAFAAGLADPRFDPAAETRKRRHPSRVAPADSAR